MLCGLCVKVQRAPMLKNISHIQKSPVVLFWIDLRPFAWLETDFFVSLSLFGFSTAGFDKGRIVGRHSGKSLMAELIFTSPHGTAWYLDSPSCKRRHRLVFHNKVIGEQTTHFNRLLIKYFNLSLFLFLFTPLTFITHIFSDPCHSWARGWRGGGVSISLPRQTSADDYVFMRCFWNMMMSRRLWKHVGLVFHRP